MYALAGALSIQGGQGRCVGKGEQAQVTRLAA
jgi:hypothetical protein